MARQLIPGGHMNRNKLWIGSFCLVVLVGSIATAQYGKDDKGGGAKPAGMPEMKLPPGWTSEDMKACMDAGTPGQMHQQLAKHVGVWNGKTTMWMAPDTEPMKSECITTITPFLDGRFMKCEVKGDMPGMGPFNGFGLYGFDNVTQKYQATWVDNCSTTILQGTGDMSSDNKVMTWTYHYTCPITKKPVTMREVHTMIGPDSQKQEMYGIDPKSGKEFKMMEIAYTRQPGTEKMGTAAAPTERTR